MEEVVGCKCLLNHNSKDFKDKNKKPTIKKKETCVLFTSWSLKLSRNLAKNMVRAVTMLLHVYVMPTYPVISIAVFLYVY